MTLLCIAVADLLPERVVLANHSILEKRLLRLFFQLLNLFLFF